jgi:hypothetical protein
MRTARCMAVIGFLLADAAAAQQAAAQQAGAWITDMSAGCKVWNPHPQPGETVHWFGFCANGFAHGRGAAQWVRNSLPFETDEGEWRSGRQAGYGTQVWPSGRYDGNLVDGEPHGHGVMIVQGTRYEGEFRNSRPNGAGTLTDGHGSFSGAWTNGCFRDGSRKASFGVPLSACP